MTSGADWVDQARRLLDAVRGPENASGAGADGHAPDCSWCPVCQAASVLRGERPEVTEAVADLLTTAAAALRAFAADAGASRPRATEEPSAPAEEPEVQRIDIA
ncbi:hypothetical protein DQ244_13850 [Blastococcus sp. TBT05-19]|uniref:hypothetical protein n=1 Tax=Blastococcus sp. TBT05-19 TaxID=2250581 RepID=UPI000DE980FE|nr:hypothetical protein [Blastococcus sp. TBT05-19]RBY88882.1 hypothetical protein DQ244_13850 [Blastococcus sp. TBT05-19]